MDQPLGDARPDFSPSTALWCPWCRRPFIGSVNLADGRFLHSACGRAGALDIDLVTELAAQGSSEAWFWERYLSRLKGDLPADGDQAAVVTADPRRRGAAPSGGRSGRLTALRTTPSRRLD